MGTVRPLVRDVLPENIFKMIEGFMLGEIHSIHIVAVTKDDEIINTSAGGIPHEIKRHDSLKRHG